MSDTGNGPAVRIGVLGAARIVEHALLQPARIVDGVEVVALAARDFDRGAAYAAAHGIARVHRDYEALLADPGIDAVYLPLPAALHAPWTVAAVAAGKHVLCEKPFTSNAAAAERVVRAASAGDRVVMEAYHPHYHPFQRRLGEIVRSGELGRVRAATASFCVPIPPGRNIRWDLSLGGGSLLDVGYYPVRLVRELLGEVAAVPTARARLRHGVDRLLTATLELESGVRAGIRSSMWSWRLYEMRFEVVGDEGRMRVSFPYHPHMGAVAHVNGRAGRRLERAGRRPTYAYQLEAFRDAVHGGPVETDAAAAAAQVRALDAIHAAAGLDPRP